MKISIVNSQKKVSLDCGRLKKIAAEALVALGEKQAELSIYIVDDAEIKNLNYRYRHVDKPTDVLSFSMREGSTLKGTEGLLGDVVISAETAVRQAHGYRKKVKDEMDLYLVDGILHLVGYDDNSPKVRSKMERLQQKLLNQLCEKRGQRR